MSATCESVAAGWSESAIASETESTKASEAHAVLARSGEQIYEDCVEQEASRLMAKDARILEQGARARSVEMTFDEKVEALRKMMSAPRFREIYFAMLDFCGQARRLGELEQMVGALPEFEYCGQNRYRLIINLEDAFALERAELDEEGRVVTEDMKEGLTDDEIDDLVIDYAFTTTEVGRVVCDEMQPSTRMEDLMSKFPKRVKTYCELLEFCKTPRSFKEIDTLLKGSEVLRSVSANTITNIPLQPSVFVEQLELSGGLVWKGSWNITEGGKKYLELIQKLAG